MRHIISQATQHFEAGALEEAKAACQEALSLLPNDPDAQRLLGLIAAAQQQFAAAVALLEPLSPHYQDDPMMCTALAEAVWVTVSAAAAIPFFRQVLHIDPARHRVRGRLGTALLQAGQPDLAYQELAQAVAARPGDSVLHLQAALAQRDLGDLGAAIEHLRNAVCLSPAPDATLLTSLGDALLEAGDLAAAMSALAQAVQRDPRRHVAWMLLGRAATLGAQYDRAVSCFRRALTVVPEDGAATVRAALANALHLAGHIVEAGEVFVTMMHAQSSTRPTASRQCRVGVLAAPGAANTPTEFLLDRSALSVETLFMVDGYDHSAADVQQRFDVVFNAISDPDEAPSALRSAEALTAVLPCEVINPPRLIDRTTRDGMARLLNGLDGAVIPQTVRCDRRDLLAGHIPPLSFPVLMRPIGSHGGKGLIRVDNIDTLTREAAAMIAPSIYLTEYCPFESDDGLWRKYRVIFIGGTWFAYHLSIGQDWLNHYFRTDTNRVAMLHAEESRFLQTPEAVLGTLASHALQLLPQRVGLQYFGVDFALDKAGRMIVFECNAAMRVRAPREKTGPKAQAASRIRDALTQMIIS